MITDWKQKCMELLECFETCEGTLYESEWYMCGISEEEKQEIIKAYVKYKVYVYFQKMRQTKT